MSFVTQNKEIYLKDIETREKPGTPAIMQAIRAALAFQIKTRVDTQTIELIDEYFDRKFMSALKDEPNILFYGPLEAEKKVPIIPFNFRHQDKILHPKFVTRLLNDLFGIQSRAGCSCADPMDIIF